MAKGSAGGSRKVRRPKSSTNKSASKGIRPHSMRGIPEDIRPAYNPPGYRPQDPLRILRPVPGAPHRYYDFQNPNETYSDYFYRKYRASRTPTEREELTRLTRRFQRGNQAHKMEVAKAYRRNTLPPDEQGLTAYQVTLLPDFKSKWARMIRASYEVETYERYDPRRDALLLPSGELAQSLLDLGLRNAEDTFPVGQSPQGWAENGVVPT